MKKIIAEAILSNVCKGFKVDMYCDQGRKIGLLWWDQIKLKKAVRFSYEDKVTGKDVEHIMLLNDAIGYIGERIFEGYGFRVKFC
jgi:hypothetical protein